MGVEAFDLRGVALAPDAKGGDAKADPGLGGADGLADAEDEEVDVLAPPVVALKTAAAIVVAFPTGPVGEREGRASGVFLRVGIKIIVEVNAIDVVAANDVEDNVEGVFLDFAFAGIEPEALGVGLDV